MGFGGEGFLWWKGRDSLFAFMRKVAPYGKSRIVRSIFLMFAVRELVVELPDLAALETGFLTQLPEPMYKEPKRL
jgi:hypothetical protein